MPATYRTATRRPTLLTGAAWRRGPRYWGDVAVVDVKASAIKAWVAKMAADEVGAPTIEVRRPRWPTRWIASLRWCGCWPTPACGGVKWPHCGCATSTWCAAASTCRAHHRIRWAGVEYAENLGAPVGSIPGLDCRRAGRADGRQGPRRSRVHRHARWGASQFELAGAGV